MAWQLAGNSDVVLESYPRERITIAPDGSAFAYADSTLHLWRDGAVVDIANSDGFADDIAATVLWAQTQWTVASGEALAEAPLPTCDGAQQSRLQAGNQARVVSSSIPNRVRDNPSTSAAQISVIPARGEFTVLDGPVCADGYAWYQVQFGDVQGWTAEGSNAEYFIEPVDG